MVASAANSGSVLNDSRSLSISVAGTPAMMLTFPASVIADPIVVDPVERVVMSPPPLSRVASSVPLAFRLTSSVPWMWLPVLAAMLAAVTIARLARSVVTSGSVWLTMKSPVVVTTKSLPTSTPPAPTASTSTRPGVLMKASPVVAMPPPIASSATPAPWKVTRKSPKLKSISALFAVMPEAKALSWPILVAAAVLPKPATTTCPAVPPKAEALSTVSPRFSALSPTPSTTASPPAPVPLPSTRTLVLPTVTTFCGASGLATETTSAAPPMPIRRPSPCASSVSAPLRVTSVPCTSKRAVPPVAVAPVAKAFSVRSGPLTTPFSPNSAAVPPNPSARMAVSVCVPPMPVARRLPPPGIVSAPSTTLTSTVPPRPMPAVCAPSPPMPKALKVKGSPRVPVGLKLLPLTISSKRPPVPAPPIWVPPAAMPSAAMTRFCVGRFSVPPISERLAVPPVPLPPTGR